MKKSIVVLMAGVIISTLSCKKEDTGNNDASKYTVSTLPGRFVGPLGITVDGFGNVYVTDANNRITKINKDGSLNYSFSGNGNYAMVDGNAQSASFWAPWGLAIDGVGNIYVADAGNNSIRKVLPEGSVNTITGGGNGSPGYINGDVSIARFNHPHGVAVDASGSIYVTDKDNKKIRKITTAGVVSTIADEFIFSDPLAITTDAGGNVYVGDFHIMRKISPGGQVTDVGEPGSYYAPTGMICANNGNLFFINRVNNTINMITPAGKLTKIAGDAVGGYADGDANTARFDSPMSLAIDASGNIYVTDFGNNVIRKIALK